MVHRRAGPGLGGPLPGGHLRVSPRGARAEPVLTRPADPADRLPLDHEACPTSEHFERARRTEAAPAAGPSLAAQADAELDRIAEVARTAAQTHRQKEASMAETQRLSETEEALGHLQVAHEARSRRLATERMVFANHLHKAEAEIGRLKDEVARLREELTPAESRAAEAEAGTRAEAAAPLAGPEELSALSATRTFRYTAERRSVYGR